MKNKLTLKSSNTGQSFLIVNSKVLCCTKSSKVATTHLGSGKARNAIKLALKVAIITSTANHQDARTKRAEFVIGRCTPPEIHYSAKLRTL